MKLKQKFIEYFNLGGKISHSYQGEDIMLWRYFSERGIKNGFFIDVGAYHPKYFNNTWRLRKKLGFTGINIEPTDNIKLFEHYREDDINLKRLVGNKAGGYAVLNIVSDEPMLSGKEVNKLVQKPDKEILVWQTTLTNIVKYAGVKSIDLLDIDVEGTEMEVLKGYDWSVMPRLILIEEDKDKDCKISRFLFERKYKKIAQTLNNGLYEL